MTLLLTRRNAAQLIASLAVTPITQAHAGRIIELHGGGFQPVSIAISPFVGDDAAQTVTSIINNNFKRSVFLKPVDISALGPNVAPPDQRPDLAAFKTIDAQYVLTGRAQRIGDGRLKTEFRLFDVTTGEQISCQQRSEEHTSELQSH